MPYSSAADFIQFALRLYSRTGMKETCLRLQDHFGLNVNCLLLAAWSARLGYSIDADLWSELQRQCTPIREAAIEPIRAVRRRISREPKLKEELRGPLKRMLLYAELRAEQAEERTLHDRMIARALKARPGPALLRQNLAAYAPPGEEIEHFATLVIESELLDPAPCPND